MTESSRVRLSLWICRSSDRGAAEGWKFVAMNFGHSQWFQGRPSKRSCENPTLGSLHMKKYRFGGVNLVNFSETSKSKEGTSETTILEISGMSLDGHQSDVMRVTSPRKSGRACLKQWWEVSGFPTKWAIYPLCNLWGRSVKCQR